MKKMKSIIIVLSILILIISGCSNNLINNENHINQNNINFNIPNEDINQTIDKEEFITINVDTENLN